MLARSFLPGNLKSLLQEPIDRDSGPCFVCSHLDFCLFTSLALVQDVSGMPSTSRPRGMSGTGSGGSGRPAVTAPMSERQQMALLMQMTSTGPGNEGGKCGLLMCRSSGRFVLI